MTTRLGDFRQDERLEGGVCLAAELLDGRARGEILHVKVAVAGQHLEHAAKSCSAVAFEVGRVVATIGCSPGVLGAVVAPEKQNPVHLRRPDVHGVQGA